MGKTTRAKIALALSAVAVLAACASGGGSTGSATTGPANGAANRESYDLPDHFLVSVTGLAQAEEPRPGEGCRNPLIDPRNSTALHLVRSKDGLGDYQVLDEQYAVLPRYGADSRHYLRIDCATGKPVGIVAH
jgi:hypothetical protein